MTFWSKLNSVYCYIKKRHTGCCFFKCQQTIGTSKFCVIFVVNTFCGYKAELLNCEHIFKKIAHSIIYTKTNWSTKNNTWYVSFQVWIEEQVSLNSIKSAQTEVNIKKIKGISLLLHVYWKLCLIPGQKGTLLHLRGQINDSNCYFYNTTYNKQRVISTFSAEYGVSLIPMGLRFPQSERTQRGPHTNLLHMSQSPSPEKCTKFSLILFTCTCVTSTGAEKNPKTYRLCLGI